jgi:hypothetical protein
MRAIPCDWWWKLPKYSEKFKKYDSIEGGQVLS